MPRIDRDAAELNRVKQGAEITSDDAEVRRSAFGVNRFSANVVWRLAGILLEERLAGYTIWKALENERPICHHRQYEGSDRGVVTHQIALGQFLLREENFTKIRDIDFSMRVDPHRTSAAVLFDLGQLIDNVCRDTRSAGFLWRFLLVGRVSLDCALRIDTSPCRGL